MSGDKASEQTGTTTPTGELSPRPLARDEWVTFWQVGDQVYRAPASGGMDTDGLPMGAAWECSRTHWDHYRRSVYTWVTDCEKAPTA